MSLGASPQYRMFKKIAKNIPVVSVQSFTIKIWVMIGQTYTNRHPFRDLFWISPSI